VEQLVSSAIIDHHGSSNVINHEEIKTTNHPNNFQKRLVQNQRFGVGFRFALWMYLASWLGGTQWILSMKQLHITLKPEDIPTFWIPLALAEDWCHHGQVTHAATTVISSCFLSQAGPSRLPPWRLANLQWLRVLYLNSSGMIYPPWIQWLACLVLKILNRLLVWGTLSMLTKPEDSTRKCVQENCGVRS